MVKFCICKTKTTFMDKQKYITEFNDFSKENVGNNEISRIEEKMDINEKIKIMLHLKIDKVKKKLNNLYAKQKRIIKPNEEKKISKTVQIYDEKENFKDEEKKLKKELEIAEEKLENFEIGSNEENKIIVFFVKKLIDKKFGLSSEWSENDIPKNLSKEINIIINNILNIYRERDDGKNKWVKNNQLMKWDDGYKQLDIINEKISKGKTPQLLQEKHELQEKIKWWKWFKLYWIKLITKFRSQREKEQNEKRERDEVIDAKNIEGYTEKDISLVNKRVNYSGIGLDTSEQKKPLIKKEKLTKFSVMGRQAWLQMTDVEKDIRREMRNLYPHIIEIFNETINKYKKKIEERGEIGIFFIKKWEEFRKLIYNFGSEQVGANYLQKEISKIINENNILEKLYKFDSLTRKQKKENMPQMDIKTYIKNDRELYYVLDNNGNIKKKYLGDNNISKINKDYLRKRTNELNMEERKLRKNTSSKDKYEYNEDIKKKFERLDKFLSELETKLVIISRNIIKKQKKKTMENDGLDRKNSMLVVPSFTQTGIVNYLFKHLNYNGETKEPRTLIKEKQLKYYIELRKIYEAQQFTPNSNERVAKLFGSGCTFICFFRFLIPIKDRIFTIKPENDYTPHNKNKINQIGHLTGGRNQNNTILKKNKTKKRIKINPKMRGVFTSKAKRNKMSVQKYATYIIKKYKGKTRNKRQLKLLRQAVFAKTVKKWKKRTKRRRKFRK